DRGDVLLRQRPFDRLLPAGRDARTHLRPSCHVGELFPLRRGPAPQLLPAQSHLSLPHPNSLLVLRYGVCHSLHQCSSMAELLCDGDGQPDVLGHPLVQNLRPTTKHAHWCPIDVNGLSCFLSRRSPRGFITIPPAPDCRPPEPF